MTPHYPNPPITEAVIDIQVRARVSVEALEGANAGESNYPKADKLNETTGSMRFAPDTGPVATASSQPLGNMYRSVDELHIYQARLNGFTLSRLARYPGWVVFSSEARRLWEKYKAVADAIEITRVALRYVNRIDMPLPLSSFSDYLRTSPELSPDLPQGLSGYFMQLGLPLPDDDCDAIINETIIESTKPGVVSVVLDIDVFRTREVPQTDTSLWAMLEVLRHAKNRVFEACITDRARELFA